MAQVEAFGYKYHDANLGYAHQYLLPELRRLLEREIGARNDRRIFELGCGNGSIAHHLGTLGYDVTGVDPSLEGIDQAKRAHPDLKVFQGSAADDLRQRYGGFSILYSLEVIEHVFLPRQFARSCFELLEPDGTLILSTPYHGYWKNLALSVTGKWDKHLGPLWDYGHIKFWSFQTLRELLEETGFTDVTFTRVGRVPIFARSMFAVARRGTRGQ